MTPSITVLLITCALLAVVSVKSAQHEREKPAGKQIQIPPGKENMPAEQVFKNIEILKGKPASRLPVMMKALNGQIGVKCTHCHVAGTWEREEPEAKRTARRMFKIIDVSQKYFDGKNEVTCWTCHHGVPKPSAGAAEIGTAMAKLPAEPPAGDRVPDQSRRRQGQACRASLSGHPGLERHARLSDGPDDECLQRRAWRGLLSLPRRGPVGRRPPGEGDRSRNAAHGPGRQPATL